jgi:hypothetical protein
MIEPQPCSVAVLQGDGRLLLFTTAAYGAKNIWHPPSLFLQLFLAQISQQVANDQTPVCTEEGIGLPGLCEAVNVISFTAGAADPYYQSELVLDSITDSLGRLMPLMRTNQPQAVTAESPYFSLGVFSSLLYGIPVGIVPSTSPASALACGPVSAPILGSQDGPSQKGLCEVSSRATSVSLTLLGPDPRRLFDASITGYINVTYVFTTDDLNLMGDLTACC